MKYLVGLAAMSVSALLLTGCNTKLLDGNVNVTGIKITLPEVCDASQGLFAQAGLSADQLGVGYLGNGITINQHTAVFADGESISQLQTELLPKVATHNYINVAFSLGDKLIPDVPTTAQFKGLSFLACKNTGGDLVPLTFSLTSTDGKVLSNNTSLAEPYTGTVVFLGAVASRYENSAKHGIYLFDVKKSTKQSRSLLNSQYKL